MRMKRIRDANLIIINDLMFMAMDQKKANYFFHLINDLHDKASVILTSNKAPKEWGELLGDPTKTATLLDQILHRVVIIDLKKSSGLIQPEDQLLFEATPFNGLMLTLSFY